jgi:fibronectin-binding autotransporter adhesin
MKNIVDLISLRRAGLPPFACKAPPFFLLFLLAGTFAFSSRVAQAAGSATWNSSPTNGNWITTGGANNWSTGASNFPGSTSATGNLDVATFGSSSTTSITINSTTLDVGSLLFDGAASAYTIGTNSNTLLLSSSGTIALGSTGTSFSNANTVETIAAPLLLEPASATTAGVYTFTNNSTTSSNVLAFTGGITAGTTSSSVGLTLGGVNTGTNTISGIIGNGGATGLVNLTKTGGGTWILSGANTYSGGTTVNGGTLLVDLSTGSLASSSALTLGGGNFTVRGASSGTSAQTLGNLTLTSATGSGITLNGNTGSGTTLTLGSTWTRNLNSTLNITLTGNSPVLASAPTVMNGIVIGSTSASPRAFATVTDSGGTGFATVNGSNDVVRYTGASTLSNTNASNVSTTNYTTSGAVTFTGTTNVSVNTLQVDTTSSNGTLDLNTSTVLLTEKAVLMTGSGNYTIQDGELGQSGGEDIIHQYGTGTLTVSARIGGTSSQLVKDGAGTLIVASTNTYTGVTAVYGGALNVTGALLNSGTVNVSAGASLGGTGSVGIVTISAGGGINMQDGTIGTLSTGNLTLNAGNGTALTFDIGSGSTGNLDKVAAGTLTIGGSGGIVINIGNVTGSLTSGTTLTNGIYTLVTDTNGAALSTAAFNNFTFAGGASSLSLDGKTLTLLNSSGALQLDVTGGTATNGKYTLTTTAGSLNVHANGGTTTLTTVIANTGTSTQDSLNYSAVTATASAGTVGTASGTTSGPNLADGSNNSPGAAQTFTSGATAGNVTVGNSATVANVNDTAETPVGSSVGATINVYSGTATWTGNGTNAGSWGTLASNFGTNWGAHQGSPGLDSNFTSTDSATFGDVGGQTTQTVTLDGASPSLNSITFNDSATSYTIAQGTSGSITLNGGAGSATVTDSATGGTQTISAPVRLGTSANVNVASGNLLTFSGSLSGTGGLTATGAGTVALTNAAGNGYSGPTAVNSGKLLVTNTSNSATGSGTFSVAGGATLEGTGIINSSSFSLNGSSSSNRALVLVGQISSSDTNSTGVLTLTGTGSSTINNVNLSFNINAAGASTNQLNVGATTIAFTGSDLLTLNLVNTPGVIAADSPFVLIAGTHSGSGAQYSGLDLASSSTAFNGGTMTQIDANGNSALLLGLSGIAQTYYGTNSYLFLYQNASGADDIEVMVVPEPSTWALLVAGLGCVITVQLRRRRA